MKPVDRIASALVEYRHVTVPVLLVLLLAVGAGVTQLQQEQGLGTVEIGTDAEAALADVEAQFSAAPGNQTVAQVVIRDENVLDEETLLASLSLQQSIRDDETIAPTLRAERPTVGVANAIGRAAVRRQDPTAADPTLARQRAAIERLNASQIDALASQVVSAPRSDALALMAREYDVGSANASATMVVVFQRTDGTAASGTAPPAIVDSQLRMEAIAAGNAAGAATFVVGDGIVTDEQRQSRQDTLSLLGPLALLFVLVTLAVVYRDVIDVALSLLGIVLVQLWTFGTLGWTGIAFNPVLIAIPVLLVGLSIDYGIHVFMRYRERRDAGEAPATAMGTALGGVGVALLWVTATTVVGFLSNVASAVGPIRELGLIAAVGIVGALVVFGLLLPPLKVHLDALLERVGLDRSTTAVGTGGGRVGTVLSAGAVAARKAPIVVLALALVVTAVTTAGALQVSTSFEPEDNIAEDTPAWTDHLPEGIQPADYTVREHLQYVDEHFLRHDARAEFLVRGTVASPAALDAMDRAEARAAEQPVTVVLADGEPRVTSPLSVMERVAARDDAFRDAFRAADTDGDGVPDANVAGLYDRLYERAPEQAASVLHREGGDYVAVRMSVSVDAGASGEAISTRMDAVAAALDGEDRTATATGDPIVRQEVQDYMLETLSTSLALTLVAVLALLLLGFRVVHDSATLGLVTLVPVAAVVSWVVGTMTLLGIPLSVVTTIVASITVGIGIDYSIHVSERFRAELERTDSVDAAITTAVGGTGAALLASAVTTAIGFGILGVAFFPVLQQFGIITAVMIVYAFLASVLVLPSLLVLWARHVAGGERPTDRPAPVAPAGAGDD